MNQIIVDVLGKFGLLDENLNQVREQFRHFENVNDEEFLQRGCHTVIKEILVELPSQSFEVDG